MANKQTSQKVNLIMVVLAPIIVMVVCLIINIGIFFGEVTAGSFLTAIIYIFSWIFVLCMGEKYRSKAIIVYYLVFWAVMTLYFFFYEVWLETGISEGLSLIFEYLILFPMIGFDFIPIRDTFEIENESFVLAIASLFMLLIGIIRGTLIKRFIGKSRTIMSMSTKE